LTGGRDEEPLRYVAGEKRMDWPHVVVFHEGKSRPPLLELALGLVCLMAVPLAGAVVFLAAWWLL